MRPHLGRDPLDQPLDSQSLAARETRAGSNAYGADPLQRGKPRLRPIPDPLFNIMNRLLK